MKNHYQVQREQQQGTAKRTAPAKERPSDPDAKTYNRAGVQVGGQMLDDLGGGILHGVTFGAYDTPQLAAAQNRNRLAFGLGQAIGGIPSGAFGLSFLRTAKSNLNTEKVAGGLLALREAARRGKRNIPGDALTGKRLDTGDPDRIRAARRHLDRLALGLGGAHGAAIGLGGIEVDTPDHRRSPVEVLKEALLGGATGGIVARSAPAALDAAPLLFGRPRISAAKQLSLTPGRSVDDLLAAATAEQEALFRAANGSPRFSRAGNFGLHEVSPQAEQNPITQQLLAMAARSEAGQERIANARRRLGQLEETSTVRKASDALRGLRIAGHDDLRREYLRTGSPNNGVQDIQIAGPASRLPSPALPDYRKKALSRSPIEDPALHPSWMREVAGERRARAPVTHQPLGDRDRQILGTDVLHRIQGLGPVRTPEDVARIETFLAQPHLREVMRTLGIRRVQQFADPTRPERGRLAQQIAELKALSAAPDVDLGAGYSAANRPRPARIMDTQDAIRETDGRLEESLAQALLDRRTSPRNVYDPTLPVGDEPLLAVTRERGPVDWVNSLPANVYSDRLAAVAALGADYGMHGAEDLVGALLADILDAPRESSGRVGAREKNKLPELAPIR